MKAESFYDALIDSGIELFCGVPDSLLKSLCACITQRTPAERNIISANEGNALATASGHYLATGKPAVVYMQNSGLGNIINPLLSLNDPDVYNIPALLIIGWRGEPGIADEPQHITQGKLTIPLLETMGVRYETLTNERQIEGAMNYMAQTNRPFAFIVRKNCFDPFPMDESEQKYELTREKAIQTTLKLLHDEDIVVSTTGMISREVYENRPTHEKDFLTVGGMGHTSSIAFGVALSKQERMVYCFDGDGSVLMHMGALPVTASYKLKNLKHIIFNNEAHDSVGGQPTVMGRVKLAGLLLNAGYERVFEAYSADNIQQCWDDFASNSVSSALIIYVRRGARKDLGRPKEKPQENKLAFMEFIKEY